MITLPVAAFAISMVLLAGNDPAGLDRARNGPIQQQNSIAANEKSGRLVVADRDDYLKTMRNDLDQLRNQIEALQRKANKSGAVLKADLEKKIRGFREDHKNLEAKWQQAKDVSESSWQEFKLSFTASMEKLRNAVHNAR